MVPWLALCGTAKRVSGPGFEPDKFSPEALNLTTRLSRQLTVVSQKGNEKEIQDSVRKRLENSQQPNKKWGGAS